VQKVIIAGTRKYRDEKRIFEELDAMRLFLGDFQVITGLAEGPDTIALKWANDRHLPAPIAFPVNWSNLSHPQAVIKRKASGEAYDAAAGTRRNQEMAQVADAAILFWDGSSPGTKDMRERMEKAGKPVCIILVKT
jgi:hypothetical protein